MTSLKTVDQRRVKILRTVERDRTGPVLYWMNRDIRAHDNWALLHASELSRSLKVPLGVVYNLDPSFLGGGLRQLSFKVDGLKELDAELARHNIPLYVTLESGVEDVVALIRTLSCSAVVTDFSPLRVQKKWLADVVAKTDVTVHMVDAHNIVPCWLASPKQEYAAATFRPKIHRALPDFLTEFPTLPKSEFRWPETVPSVDWDHLLKSAKTDRRITPVTLPSGEKAAHAALQTFIAKRLDGYAEGRNDPSLGGQSELSPYLHYGFLSPQRAAFNAKKSAEDSPSLESFLEELIVRRELSDNFCHYQSQYDSVAGFPDWAKKTLDAHRKDPRPFLYDEASLEQAKTHDPYWNAAQTEMVTTGKMHGYMRMYWAKKILEWSKTPEDAMRIAIRLNDTYELDGRDPNGYTGVAWAIGGVHDRPWAERAVFGMVRYMNDGGLKRKFDIDEYVRKVEVAARLI